MIQIQDEFRTIPPVFIKAMAKWAGVDPASLDQGAALMIFLSAAAVWCWDRGDAHTCHAFATAALAESVACPPAFVRIYRAISMKQRHVSARRIAHVKRDSLCVLQAIGNVGIHRATLDECPPLALLELRGLQRDEKQARKAEAARVGLSVGRLEAAERDFRALLREIVRKD